MPTRTNMTIDFHTHVFPNHLAAAAISTLSGRSLIAPEHDGTLDGLLSSMQAADVDYSVVLGIATNEKQQRKVNDFAFEINKHEKIIGFGSVFPYAPDAFNELERIKALGLKGIKLHPDYQGFFVDDEQLFPLFNFIGSLGLITVFHAGYDIGLPEPVHGSPGRLAKALPHFKGAPVVAAHFGGYMQWMEAEKFLAGKDCYFDTSFTYGRIPYPQAARLIEKHGAGRFLFGSDSPWSPQGAERRFVEKLFKEDEAELVLGENARRLLTISLSL
jgi:predicted TIM-barrel fold metal-dependent hydrolase